LIYSILTFYNIIGVGALHIKESALQNCRLNRGKNKGIAEVILREFLPSHE
jgi:hypothetical protein